MPDLRTKHSMKSSSSSIFNSFPLHLFGLKLLLITGICLFCKKEVFAARSLPMDQINDAAHSTQWRRLLHYDKSFLFGDRSLNDGKGFFFSRHGKTDLKAELIATLDAMNQIDIQMTELKIHPQCAFPARKRFLESIGLKLETAVECPELDRFKARFRNPQTLSVVFSTAYPNNPASMFGHSFLKFHSDSGSDLTDLGIDYAARVPPDEHPLAFIFFGIFGGYRGQWSTNSYHQKVKEYAQSENRDLWEYELNFTPEETLFLIEHIWELELNGHFDYFFFDENCSYHILAAIEAIKPDWNLTQHKIYVIPGESIKNLTDQPGAVRQVHFRPSAQTKWRNQIEKLPASQRALVRTAIQKRRLAGTESTEALSGLIAYMQFLDAKKKGKLTETERGFQQALWKERATRGPEPHFLKPEPPKPSTRPDFGHDAYSLTIEQTLRDRRDRSSLGSTTQLRIKSAYHDLLNRDEGFRKYSHIDFPAIQLQFDNDLNEFRIDEVNFLAITSMTPIEFDSKSFSWSFESGINTPRDYGCLSCRHGFLEGGIGASTNLWTHKQLAYLLFLGRPEISRPLGRGYRILTGAEFGMFFNSELNLKVQVGIRDLWDLTSPSISANRISTWFVRGAFYLDKNLELRFETELLRPEGRRDFRQVQNTLSLSFFFR